MTIEILYLTAQMQRWLNFQVARHLEAQAARLNELGADGPGGSVGLDRRGMPEGYLVDETESTDTIRAVAARHSAAQPQG
jgi:predicted amidohydrolase YtcJ